MNSFLEKFVGGDPVRKYWKRVEAINKKEREYASLSPEELKQTSLKLKGRVEKGEPLEDALEDHVQIVRLSPYRPEVYKSSKLAARPQ